MLHAFNKNLGGYYLNLYLNYIFFFIENIRGRRDFQKSGGGHNPLSSTPNLAVE